MSKFTPGPWYVNQLTPHKQIKESMCIASDEGPITFMSTVSINYIDTLWANARLIAAAPELYEALSMAIEAMRDHNIDESMAGEFEILTDALAKVEGK